ncbi:MAG TPA: outer membrane lipoprotein carrier protein LolA [Caulobacteraceae bacterium]|nr:outer membrane lipoprotein carrier protein LolA [Caulobacteraceae bacterium]
MVPFKPAQLLVAILLVAPSSAPAAAASNLPRLSASDEATVRAAAAYLGGLTSVRAHFVQTGARGTTSQGEFYLQRPGKARFDYAPPSGLTIASNGQVVSVLDTRLNSFQSYPLGMTPLSLFLSKEVRLDRGVEVTSVTASSDGFSITARDGRRRSDGQIALYFQRAPLTLLGWTITDAQGASTRVRLTDLSAAGPFDRHLFTLRPPRPSPDQLR